MGNVLIDSIKGAFFFGFFIIIFYAVWFMLKKSGFVDRMKKKLRPNPPQKIKDEIVEFFSDKTKTFNDFAEMISKYKLKKQRMYLDAYMNFREPKKIERGLKNNDRQRKSKRNPGKTKTRGK